MFQKVYTGIAVALLCAVLLAWVAIAGDVRVNSNRVNGTCRRLDNAEKAALRQSQDLSEIKADVRAIKAILERMEKQ